MALNPGIALQAQVPQFENRLSQLAQMEQLGAMQDRRRMTDMQLAAAEREASENRLLSEAVRESGGDLDAAAQTAIGRGAVRGGLGLQKSAAEARESKLKAQKLSTEDEKARLETNLMRVNATAQILASASDQASYDAARQQLAALPGGAEAVQRMPPQFNPTFIAQTVQQGMTLAQRMEQDWKAKGYDLDRDRFAEQKRHNRASEATAAQSAANAAQKPGQFFTLADGTTVVGDPRTGMVYPARFGGPGMTGAVTGTPGNVTPPAGGPSPMPGAPQQPAPGAQLGPAGAPSGNAPVPGLIVPGGMVKQAAPRNDASEDERKAAGWYTQATTALANMNNALAENPSAATPGTIEAVARGVGVPEDVVNSRLSPQRQRFIQAASSMSEAVLRAATGAGVNENEARQKIRELTPIWGEDPSVTAQKMRGAEMYVQSLASRAGRALPASTQGGAVPPASNASTSGPAINPNDPLGLFGNQGR